MKETQSVVGIDNGVTGAYCVFVGNQAVFLSLTPVKRVRDYTKTEQYIHRIDNDELCLRLLTVLRGFPKVSSVKFLLERPMINPMRFKQSISAARAFESTLIAFEGLQLHIHLRSPKMTFETISDAEWKENFKFPKNISKEKVVEKALSYKDFVEARKGDSVIKYTDLQMSALADAYFIAKFGSRTFK